MHAVYAIEREGRVTKKGEGEREGVE